MVINHNLTERIEKILSLVTEIWVQIIIIDSPVHLYLWWFLKIFIYLFLVIYKPNMGLELMTKHRMLSWLSQPDTPACCLWFMVLMASLSRSF